MRKAMIFVWVVILGGAAFIQFLNQTGDVLEGATSISAEEMGVGTPREVTTTQAADTAPAAHDSRGPLHPGFTLTRGCELLDEYLALRGDGTDDETDTMRDLRGFGMRVHGVATNGEPRDTFGKALRDVAQATGTEYTNALNTAQDYCSHH